MFYRAWNREIQIDAELRAPSSQLLTPQHKQLEGGIMLYSTPVFLVVRILSLEALAESEQRFHELVEALPDAILVHSENKIVFVNPFCTQLIRRDISGIIDPLCLSEIRDRILSLCGTGLMLVRFRHTRLLVKEARGNFAGGG